MTHQCSRDKWSPYLLNSFEGCEERRRRIHGDNPGVAISLPPPLRLHPPYVLARFSRTIQTFPGGVNRQDPPFPSSSGRDRRAAQRQGPGNTLLHCFPKDRPGSDTEMAVLEIAMMQRTPLRRSWHRHPDQVRAPGPVQFAMVP